MAKFIDRVVGTDEKIIIEANIHWIYIITGMVWFAGFLIIGLVLNDLLWVHFGVKIPFHKQEVAGIPFGVHYPWIAITFGAAGLVILILHILKVFCTEIALTNERIIYKTGWIFVDVKEIDLAEIRAEKVNHGLIGRFLKYGELHLDSRFVGDVYLPAVHLPYALLRAIHTQRKNIRDPFYD